MRNLQLSAVLGAVLLFCSPAFAGDKLLPTVISFAGTGEAKIISGNTARPVSVGLSIEYGSVIRTTAANTVTVEYPDQSILTVDADSEVEIQERTGGTQSNKLNSGQVRASVVKLKTGQIVPEKPRFVVRTKAAVLGVRGTEFAVAVDPTGYTTQVHTIEGVVDVATDEAKLLSGGGTPVNAGQFVEASGKGLGNPQVFDREEFANSLKPSVPGGPSNVVFTNPSGHTLSAPDILKLGDPRVNPEPPKFKKEEEQQKQLPEKQQEQQQQPQSQLPPNDEEARRVMLGSFQLAFFYTSGFSDPAFGFLREPTGPQPVPPAGSPPPGQYGYFTPNLGAPYRAVGFADRIRAFTFSWNPTIPVPVLKFLYLRGNFGFTFARDGSLLNRLFVNESQLFLNATLFRKFFGEVGMGKQTWLHSPISEGLFTTNVGLQLRNKPFGFEIERIFVGRSLLMTHPRVEEFRAGFGFGF